jgi:hypothetical protein
VGRDLRRGLGRALAVVSTSPRLLGPVSTAIVDVAAAVALVLALHVAFVALDANPRNAARLTGLTA